MTRWLVTGASGQLGSDLVRVLATRDGDSWSALTHAELDITDAGAVRAALDAVRPKVVVNAAAYTAVDAAETDEERAYRVNATGPGALAHCCRAQGATLVHISTDYVFAGDSREPYAEDAATGPRSVYGRTKLAGEYEVREALDEHYIVRTAWVYGRVGENFVKTMSRLESERDTVSVVDDQCGSPTWSYDLARGLVELVDRAAPYGTYHCTNSGETTWYGFARAIFQELGAEADRVLPTSTAAFPRPAPRPAYSVLSAERWHQAGLTPLPHWRDALRQAMPAIRASGRSGEDELSD